MRSAFWALHRINTHRLTHRFSLRHQLSAIQANADAYPYWLVEVLRYQGQLKSTCWVLRGPKFDQCPQLTPFRQKTEERSAEEPRTAPKDLWLRRGFIALDCG